jgi:hypothetical protein
MNKLWMSATLSVVMGTTLAGCKQDQAADVAAIRAALPQADAVQIKVPGGSGKPEARTLGELAKFYLITRSTSVDLNRGAAAVLALVHAIVEYPVTSVDGDTYIWGPWTEALNPSEYRLTVVESAPGEYTWSLEGRKKADGQGAAYRAVVSGLAIPDAPLHGQGSFMMDFDTAEELDPAGNDGQGRISIDYDLSSTPKSVVMDYERTETPPGGVAADVTFHYEYREQADGAGDFVYTVHGDLDDNGSAWETLDIRSRWLPTGAGRSDVTVAGGDLHDAVLTGVECWDTSFGRVYWSDSLGWEPAEGSVDSCAL